jgi:hypothetical protein
MELTLTPAQKKDLNEHGPIKAEALQRIYRRSVQDQLKMLKEAEKIRAKQKSK